MVLEQHNLAFVADCYIAQHDTYQMPLIELHRQVPLLPYQAESAPTSLWSLSMHAIPKITAVNLLSRCRVAQSALLLQRNLRLSVNNSQSLNVTEPAQEIQKQPRNTSWTLFAVQTCLSGAPFNSTNLERLQYAVPLTIVLPAHEPDGGLAALRTGV